MTQKILLVNGSGAIDEQINPLANEINGSWQILKASQEEVLQRATQEAPDYILFDSPGHDQRFVETLESLQQNGTTQDIPVVVLCCDRDTNTIRNYMHHGIEDFLIKPLNMDELFLRLESLGKRHRQMNQSDPKAKRLSDLFQVAQNTANALVVFDADGTIEWVNRGFERMYGYTLETYHSLYGHEIFAPESKRLQMAIEQFREGEEAVTLEHEITTFGGQKKWIQTTLTPIFGTEQVLKRIVAVESDITELRKEKQRSDELLLNILPFEIAEQLKKKGKAKSKKYKTVTVMFADFANFTGLTKIMSVNELIDELNFYVQQFDEIAGRHYIEKIKTIGDAYMCAGGLPLKNNSNPFDVTLASLEIRKFISDMARRNKKQGKRVWQLRLGIHTGEVMAGVIGSKRFAYDIWGNTVNIASKMEEMSEVGKINISGDTGKYIGDYFDLTYRGKVQMKNTPDVIDMYFVNRLKPEYSEDDEGIYPNRQFLKILSQY